MAVYIYTLFCIWHIKRLYVVEGKLKNKFIIQAALTPIGSHTNLTTWFFIILLGVC